MIERESVRAEGIRGLRAGDVLWMTAVQRRAAQRGRGIARGPDPDWRQKGHRGGQGAPAVRDGQADGGHGIAAGNGLLKASSRITPIRKLLQWSGLRIIFWP